MKSPINLFLDTSIYVSNGFSLQKPMFKTLKSLCENGRISLFTTDITDYEIESNILDSLKSLKSEFKRIQSGNRIIETVGGDGYRDLFNTQKVISMASEIKSNIDSYLAECNVEMLKASNQRAEDIFKDYFSKKPPFGEGKKKAEFPDAFVLNALDRWCTKENTEMSVISIDKDFLSYCVQNQKFNYYERLYQFISWILKDEIAVVSVVGDLVTQNKGLFDGEISKQLEWNGVYLDDADGEIFFQSIEDWSFIDVSVVEIEEDYANVLANVEANLNLQANYWDPDSWYTVKDDGVKEVHYHNKCEGEFQAKFDVEVEIGITFNAEKFKIKEVEEVSVNSGSSLAYSHYDYDNDY
jgi:hypothetical protein